MNQHVHAEWRESPRIFSLVREAIARGETPERALALSPARYTLGKGHCRFFYTRLAWLTRRHALLTAELVRRGYRLSYLELPAWTGSIGPQWYGQWEPMPEDVRVNVGRINERLRGMGLAHRQILV